MSELQDYLFGELNMVDHARVEKDLAASAEMRNELRRLEMTSTALRLLPNEEPPQRIAFVSDKLFAPSIGARISGWMLGAVPVLASAALSGLVVFSIMDHQPAHVATQSAIERRADAIKAPAQQPADIQKIVNVAVAAAEARTTGKMRLLMAEADRKHEMERKQMLLDVQDTMAYMQKKMNVLQVASADLGPR